MGIPSRPGSDLLVDSSVWIDHLHRSDTTLVAALEEGRVRGHPLVVEELATGSIADRSVVLDLLDLLPRAAVIDHHEFMTFASAHHLWGQGLSPTDIHLLGSAFVTPDLRIWTRDRRLRDAGQRLGLDSSLA
ncbi:MAG: VapC toxin family PIN domain ribonuclease [Dermatophilaceae bacterium]